MNATEQKLHTRKTDELADVIAGTQAAVLERFEEVERNLAQLRDRLGDERTFRLKLAQEQRAYVDAEDQRLQRDYLFRIDEVGIQLNTFQTRTFWARLGWLLTGE